MTHLANTALRSPSPPAPSLVTVCTTQPSSEPSPPRFPPALLSARSMRTTCEPYTTSPVSASSMPAGPIGNQHVDGIQSRLPSLLTLFETFHQLVTADNTRLGAQQSALNAIDDVRFELAHLPPVEPLQGHVSYAFRSHLFSLFCERTQIRYLRLCRGDDELASSAMRYSRCCCSSFVRLCASSVKQLTTSYT